MAKSKEIEFNYTFYKSILATVFSLFIVYWMYKLTLVFSSIDNKIDELPYLIRLTFDIFFPNEIQAISDGYDKLNNLAYFFLITFSIKGIVSLIKVFNENLENSYKIILFFIIAEFFYIYLNFNLYISEIIALLIVPNIVIYGLLFD